MAISFPSNPNSGDTYVANGKTWKFNGTKWTSPPVVADVSAPTQIASATQPTGTINTGSIWFNTSTNAVQVYTGSSWSNVSSGGGTGAFSMPVGNTAQRPASPSVGMTRINTDTGYLEVYYASQWYSSAVVSPVGSQANPASSVSALRSGGVTTDGAYWFSTSKQATPFQAYVKFNYIDGGDWALLLKVHNQGDMPSGSTYWTNTTLNNESDWNMTSGSWSKYATWNGIPFTRLMMVMTQGGTAKVPPIMIFNTARTMAEAITAAGTPANGSGLRCDSTDPAIATSASYWGMTMKSGTNFTDSAGSEDLLQHYGISCWCNNSNNATTAEGYTSIGRAGAWIGCAMDEAAGHVFNNVGASGADSGFGFGYGAGNPAKTSSAGYGEWTNSASTNTLPGYVWVR